MKKRGWKWSICIVCVLFVSALSLACSPKETNFGDLPYNDQNLTGANAAALEASAEYRTRFKNGDINIGDVMPFYDKGVYHFFYLAEGGGNTGHPVYRTDTTDFVNFTDKGMALAPGSSTSQDSMIGTGSVAKAGDDYFFFYTGFLKDSPEAVMVARSNGNIDSFVKIDEFKLLAHSSLDGWDFRDPEAVFDGQNFILFISARKNGKPVIARYTVSLDLKTVSYDGVVYEDARLGANVLECPDVFQIGNKWYLTYSVQDVNSGGNDGANAAQANVGTNGKMFYAVADSIVGPFRTVYDASLDSMAFYAAKTAQSNENTFLAGWIRQKGANAGWQYLWGGNLQIHQLTANADGTLNVAMPETVNNYYSVQRELLEPFSEYNEIDMIAENKDYHSISNEYSSYMLHTTVNFDQDAKEFGFALAVSSNTDNIVEVSFVPHANKLRSSLKSRQELASKTVKLTPNKDYDVKLLVEGSAVTVYLNNSIAFTSRVRNIGNKKLAVFAKEGSVSFRNFRMYTPSEYADTLWAGGSLKATDAGGEIKGSIKSVTVSPQKNAEITYTSKSDNHIRYTFAAVSDSDARINIIQGGKLLQSAELKKGELVQLVNTAALLKNETISVKIEADSETRVQINAGFETDKKAFDAKYYSRLEGKNSAQFTAGKSGIYAYTATMNYEGTLAALPAFSVGDNSYVSISDDKRLVSVRGAVYLNSGETLAAGVKYNRVGQLGSADVRLDVYEGKDVFSTGVGTITTPVADNLVMATETVPEFKGDFELEENRRLNVTMNGDTFGEQGKSGFVYAYGRASDELYPMTEFNTNGEIWEYKHKAAEASDALEIKADYMKQGAGFVTAVVWIAPTDGLVGYVADYKKNNEGFVQVQVWHNRTKLYDALLGDENPKADIAINTIEVKEGDSLVLSVRAAGTLLAENDGTYHLSVIESVDLNAPTIAEYSQDFSSERQGDYGWRYMRASYQWSPEKPTDMQDLVLENGAWTGGGSRINDKGRIFGNETTAVWKNTSGKTLRINAGGKITVATPTANNVSVRIWIISGDGGQKLKEGFFRDTFDFTLSGITLANGDMLAVIFFDNGGEGCDLTMKIGASDSVVIDKTAFNASLAKAKAITNADGRYTEASFAALTSAINAAEISAPNLNTYDETALATAEIKKAIAGLKKSNTAAKADLAEQITRAEQFDGKQLLGGRESLDEALTEAEALYGNADATVESLESMTAKLEAILDGAAVKVADYAADFSAVQGENGWQYRSAEISFSGGFNISKTTELSYDAASQTYKNGEAMYIGNKTLRTDEAAQIFAAVGFKNYTSLKHRYVFKGSAEYKGAAAKAVLAYAVLNADGSFKTSRGDWHEYSTTAPLVINESFELEKGETFLIVLRDIDKTDSTTDLVLQVGCNDVLSADKAALQAIISQAEAIVSADYTPESYAVLSDALVLARQTFDKPNASAGEVQNAATMLSKALKALVLSDTLAFDALSDAVSAFKLLDSADFTSETFAPFQAALTAAEQLISAGIENTTTLELNEKLNELNTLGSALDYIVTDAFKDYPAQDSANVWSYVRSGIDWAGGAKLVEANFTALAYNENVWSAGDEKVEKSGSNLSVSTTAGLALIFTVDKDAEYKISGIFEGATRNNARFFKAAASGNFAEIGWIGTDTSFSKTLTLKAGDRLAVHIEGTTTNAQFNLQITRNYTA